MGDFEELQRFVAVAISPCIVPRPDNVLTQFLVGFNFIPVYFGAFLFGMTIFRCDYRVLLITFSHYINSLLNVIIRDAVGPTDNVQPDTCPILTNQLPAFASQWTTALMTVFWFIIIYLYPSTPGTSYILFLNFCIILILYSRPYLRFSTPVQMVAGAGVGIIVGMFLSFLIYYLKIHSLDSKIVSFLRHYYTIYEDPKCIGAGTCNQSSSTSDQKHSEVPECTNHNPLFSDCKTSV